MYTLISQPHRAGDATGCASIYDLYDHTKHLLLDIIRPQSGTLKLRRMDWPMYVQEFSHTKILGPYIHADIIIE